MKYLGNFKTGDKVIVSPKTLRYYGMESFEGVEVEVLRPEPEWLNDDFPEWVRVDIPLHRHGMYVQYHNLTKVELVTDNLIREKDELSERLSKLNRLVTSGEIVDEVGVTQAVLMVRQVEVMEEYLSILKWRIDDFQKG